MELHGKREISAHVRITAGSSLRDFRNLTGHKNDDGCGECSNFGASYFVDGGRQVVEYY